MGNELICYLLGASCEALLHRIVVIRYSMWLPHFSNTPTIVKFVFEFGSMHFHIHFQSLTIWLTMMMHTDMIRKLETRLQPRPSGNGGPHPRVEPTTRGLGTQPCLATRSEHLFQKWVNICGFWEVLFGGVGVGRIRSNTHCNGR